MHDHAKCVIEGNIEDFVERNDRGGWIMTAKDRYVERIIDIRIDFCPWCGKELK